MKVNKSDILLKATMEKMIKFTEKALEELEFIDSEGEVDLSKEQEQQLIEFIIEKEVFTKGENIKNLWKAINDTDLVKLNELKSNIADDEYAEILIISSLINSSAHNNEIIKFLLTETEISEWHNLKAEMMSNFLEVDNEAELNEEIIELLRIENESSYQKELLDILSNENISDEFFIKSFENSPNLDINKPIIIEISHGHEEAFHDEERSILERVTQFNRLKLVQYLLDKGAKLLSNEIQSFLRNSRIPDEFFINNFENSQNLDVNKPIMTKVRGLDGLSAKTL